MTESSIFASGHSLHPRPGTNNKPAASRGALAFNPLHPSMELPPEQLIRLLGMESKKTRKHMKTRRASNPQKSRPAIDEQKNLPSSDAQKSRCVTDEQEPQISQNLQQAAQAADKEKIRRSSRQAPGKKTTNRQQQPEPQQAASPSHPMEYERNTPAAFDRPGLGWLLPALVIGLVAGVTISASLFWLQSSTATKQETTIPRMSSEPRHRQAPQQQPKNQPVKRKAAADSAKTATLPSQAPAKTARTGNDAKLQATIKTEQNRLRRAAEQRLAEQLTRVSVSRELEDLQAVPTDAHTPAAAATLSTAAEPTFDQAVVTEPATTVAESLASEEAPVGMIQADETKPAPETLPAVSPAQPVGSDRNGEMFEESTDLLERFEQDAAPDVAPALEQDTVSSIAPSLDVNTTTLSTHPAERDSASDDTLSRGAELDAEQSTSTTSDESPSSAAENSALF